jgi:hypothetical protein
MAAKTSPSMRNWMTFANPMAATAPNPPATMSPATSNANRSCLWPSQDARGVPIYPGPARRGAREGVGGRAWAPRNSTSAIGHPSIDAVFSRYVKAGAEGLKRVEGVVRSSEGWDPSRSSPLWLAYCADLVGRRGRRLRGRRQKRTHLNDISRQKEEANRLFVFDGRRAV